MALDLRAVAPNSLLRTRQVLVHAIHSQAWFTEVTTAAAAAALQGLTLERSSFPNKFLPCARSITMRVLCGAGGSNRNTGAQFFGRDMRGRAISDILITPAGGQAPSTTVVYHSSKVFADVHKVLFGGMVNFNEGAGDVWSWGLTYTGEVANVKWGIPIDISGLADILSASETSGALIAPTSVDASLFTFDPQENAIKFGTAAVAANDLVSLLLHSSVT